MFGRDRVRVEQNLFRRFHRAMPAAVNVVLFPRFRAGVVKVIGQPGGYTLVGLLDSANHFFVKGFLERPGMSHSSFGIVVLGVDIRPHFRVFPFSQPEIRIDPRVIVEDELVRPLGSDWWGLGH